MVVRSTLRTGQTLLLGRFEILIYDRLSRIQGHSGAGSIRSIEKSNDLIGNRTRDLPACSIVLEPTTLPRALCVTYNVLYETDGFRLSD
jgi:hypothetical protein